MKKLLLVALFVAIPALVLAQANPTTTTPAKTEVKKVESTTSTTATKSTTPTKEAVKTETKKVESATTTTKTPETATTAATAIKTGQTPEMVVIGEITNLNNAERVITLKTKDTNKEERLSFKETNPSLKTGLKIKATYEKDASGKLWLKKFEEQRY